MSGTGGRRPAVVLCGPMGSGKSAVGRRVATALELGVRDTDADVEETAGRSIPEIFESDGEAAFRALEHEAVARALVEHDGVVSLGGGAVLHPDTQAVLEAYRAAGGVVVFLDVSARTAALRIGVDANRPLLHAEGETPRQRWERLMGERRPTYEAVATHRVSTDRRTPAAVAREVLAILEALDGEG